MRTASLITFLIWTCSSLAVSQDRTAGAGASIQSIGPEAIWAPGMSIMQSVRDQCSSMGGSSFGQCFASAMRKSGASPQAVAFTNLIGNTGYLRDFREAGRVDVAYVYYPFRANENQGCLLVNGDPAVVDVDDWDILRKVDLTKDPNYVAISEQSSNVTLFPGDRSGTDYPVAKTSTGGGQRFIVSYRLLKGCHACEVLGSAKIAFDFDGSGKFSGAKLLGVDKAAIMPKH